MIFPAHLHVKPLRHVVLPDGLVVLPDLEVVLVQFPGVVVDHLDDLDGLLPLAGGDGGVEGLHSPEKKGLKCARL